jgi:hypothetical protein
MSRRLYIPGGSAHPANTLKSAIIGTLQRYWKQNNREEDLVSITIGFTSHLTKSGHKVATITVIFEESGINIDRGPPPAFKPTRNDANEEGGEVVYNLGKKSLSLSFLPFYSLLSQRVFKGTQWRAKASTS